MRFALTFDDGPDPRWTPAVLDALAAASAPATFFVLGGPAREHPELLGRAHAEGHAVQVHADEHVRQTSLSEAEAEQDLARALAAIAAAGVPAPTRWRTPWGVTETWTWTLAERRGLEVVGWTADTEDWAGPDATTMLEGLLPRLRDGAIVLCHDGLGPGATRPDCAQTAELVGPLVAAARARGIEPEALR